MQLPEPAVSPVAPEAVVPASIEFPQLSPGTFSSCTAKHADEPAPQGRYPLHLTIDEHTRDLLRYAQELLSHKIPSGDPSRVIHLALNVLIGQLEKRKYAATVRPRSKSKAVTGRAIPAAVKREVWKRDGEQCTFVSETGRRCSSRKFLEFDHVLEFALGGQATSDGIRLRCRAHNQFTAEQTFGAGFMDRKREEARRAVPSRASSAVTAARSSPSRAKAENHVLEAAPERDVTPWLRRLGFTASEVRRAAAWCETMPDASLEDRVRFAIASLRH